MRGAALVVLLVAASAGAHGPPSFERSDRPRFEEPAAPNLIRCADHPDPPGCAVYWMGLDCAELRASALAAHDDLVVTGRARERRQWEALDWHSRGYCAAVALFAAELEARTGQPSNAQ